MIRSTLLFLFCMTITLMLHSQDKYNVSGKITDSETGEALIGASVSVEKLKTGVFTNSYGFYSISLPADSVEIRFSYIGYGVLKKKVLVNADLKLDVALDPESKTLEDVVIEANSMEDRVNSSQMSVDQLSIVEARKIPALFGEVDIIKTLQLKPGVQSGGEGMSGIYVRGGGPDQNLVLLDDAPVYNPTHLFGLFSTFNGDAVKEVKLYKGGYPAEFGGKLSSVIDVHLKEGNNQKFAASGGLGAISSRLTIEGPIIKDKASFLIAGRRTYSDVITRVINDIQEGKPNWQPIPDYYFYDLNAKVNYKIGEKDHIYASGYYGRDKFGFSDNDFKINLNWGNTAAALRWAHIFNPRLFLKTSATFSDYNYQIKNDFAQLTFDLGSGVRDQNLKSELTWLPSSRHEVKAGLAYTYHTFSIIRFNASSEDGTINFNLGNDLFGHEMGVYINEEFKVNSRLTLNGGLRGSGFVNVKQFYNGIEPRFSAKYSLNEKTSLKGSFTRMFQYVHMVSNSGASLPTDIWYPSNKVVNPQRSDQVAAGISKMIGKNWMITDEVYYKWLKNQVDFRDGAQIFFNPNLDEEFVFGKGWGYGNEIYIEKAKGDGNSILDRTSGWVGYTYSWAWREFDRINGGEKFHPRYDRRHDVSVVLIHQLNKRISLTGTWVYGTGQAVSLPVGRFFLFNSVPGTNPGIIPDYTARNSFRMPPYHRMDLGFVYDFFFKKFESDITVSIYNVYNRRNPYFIYFDTEKDQNGNPIKFVPKQVSLFPIIPSVTWNFKF